TAAACRVSLLNCGHAGVHGQYMADPTTGVVTGSIQGDFACEPQCNVDADCPAADSGTSSPRCWKPDGISSGTCYLPCGGGESCPSGFSCHEKDNTSAHPSWCTQPINEAYTHTYPPESTP
ncbi:MAG TPA: hypothetical protein VGQ57_21375, partial [Polyangiaceae bacterium]|nr:hypothetical protein [Polyangiaceae bacterium]